MASTTPGGGVGKVVVGDAAVVMWFPVDTGSGMCMPEWFEGVEGLEEDGDWGSVIHILSGYSISKGVGISNAG